MKDEKKNPVSLHDHLVYSAVTAQPHEKERSEEPAAKTSTETGTETSKLAEGEEAAAAGSTVKGKEETSKQGSSWMSGWGMSSISDMVTVLVNTFKYALQSD